MKKTFQLCVCFYNICEGKTDGCSYKTMFMFNLVSGVPVPKELFIWWRLEKWSSLHWCRNAATVPIWIARIIFTNNLWVLDRINKTDRGWTAVDTARIPGENPHASTCFLFVIFYLIFLWLQTTSKRAHTYSGFPVTEQERLSESPSRKMPEGGTIFTEGATVGRQKQRPVGRWWACRRKVKKTVRNIKLLAQKHYNSWINTVIEQKKGNKEKSGKTGRNTSLWQLFPRQLAYNHPGKTAHHCCCCCLCCVYFSIGGMSNQVWNNSWSLLPVVWLKHAVWKHCGTMINLIY